MTPANIAGMASLKGLNIVALTDHNSCANCPAFFAQCKKYGIIPIAGMELTTSEDIHIICLFRTLSAAMDFEKEIKKHRLQIQNRPDIFGEQIIYDENDQIIGYEDILLINATDLDIHAAITLVKSFDGITFPAHIDREANGIISTLGDIPKEYNFSCIEFNDGNNIDAYNEKYSLENYKILCSSDAHYLENINEAENYFMIDDEPYSSLRVRKNLLDMIGQKK